MCGIAGAYHLDISHDELTNMLRRLVHRGPDNLATYRDHPFHAGMCRLSINGVEDGNQPLYNENEDIVLLYNGEIYNAQALRTALRQKGHHFRTHSDGEVICHLYEEMGTELFSKLDGMFAIALWLKKEQILILARDFIGEKPLYYTQHDNGLLFASEMKAFGGLSRYPLSLNEQAIWDFPTFLWIPEPHTIFKEVQALEPGHFLTISAKGIEKKAYYTPCEHINDAFNLSSSDVALQTKTIVEDSIKSRLMSEVPVGCFLSGGLDSSIVTTISSHHLKELYTFSIGFEDLDDPYHGKSDESALAQDYAQQLGTKHQTIHVTGHDFKALLPQFCHHGDQPFAVSSGLGILAIAKQAHETGVKVLLSGDGADEFFGGYSWYPNYSALQNVKGIQTNENISFQSVGLSLKDKLEHISRYSRAQQAWAWHYYAHEQDKQALFHSEWVNHSQLLSSIRHFDSLEDINDNHYPLAFLQNDRKLYFPNEMLTKVDRMCMAYSVESRVPLASQAVIDWARQLPFSALIQGNRLKCPLRDAFEHILPPSILQRPKHGFNVPVDHWLKTSWADLLKHTFSKASALSQRGLLSQNAYEVAKKLLNDPMTLHGHTLFCFIMLNMWLENEYNRNYC